MENMENLKKSEEKTCSKCKESRKKMTPYIIMSVVVFGLIIFLFNFSFKVNTNAIAPSEEINIENLLYVHNRLIFDLLKDYITKMQLH